MPLSEREQQILQEIEKDLLSDHPHLADTRRAGSSGSRRTRGGILLFIVGVFLLAAFFATSAIVLGLAAFAAMVGGVILFAGGLRDAFAGKGAELGGRKIADLLGRPTTRGEEDEH